MCVCGASEGALRGAPRGVEEIEISPMYAGVHQGSRVVQDGWRETVNSTWCELEMTHTVANHNAGEVALQDIDAHFPTDLFRFTTNNTEAKFPAPKRRARQKCGRGIPKLRGCDLYTWEFQWAKWHRRPYVPRLLDSMLI